MSAGLEYVETAARWLGDVPREWRKVPLWTLFRRVKRTGFEDEQLLSVYRDHGVIPKSSRDDNFNKPSDDLSLYQLVEPGDLAINKMKAWQGSAAISGHRGIVSPAYFVFQAQHGEDSQFLHYLFRSAQYTAGYLSMSKGIRPNQWDLEPQEHSRMPVYLPPLGEQAAIAAFLDRETAKIDALVEEQQRLIELLKEKRRAIISHAVTKGLDPAARLKRSGIEWLGDIPAHWEVKRLRYLGEAIIGLTYAPDDVVAEGLGTLVLRSSNVQSGKITFDDNVYVSVVPPERLVTRVGDILICSRNGSRALIGKNALIDQGSAGMTFGAFMTIFRGPYNGYLAWVLNSSLFDAQAGAYMSSTISQLTTSTLNAMEVPLPPADERTTIADRLQSVTSRIDKLLGEAQAAVGLLRERRAAIISAAVTGKIDLLSSRDQAA